MSSRLPPNFFGPSAGDRLLSSATSCKLELHRWPADQPHDDDGQVIADRPPLESEVELNFELRGQLPPSGSAAELLEALINEFRQPRSPRQEGGAA
jgi:hypothetical protein